jgi:hypothetical protein
LQVFWKIQQFFCQKIAQIWDFVKRNLAVCGKYDILLRAKRGRDDLEKIRAFGDDSIGFPFSDLGWVQQRKRASNGDANHS